MRLKILLAALLTAALFCFGQASRAQFAPGIFVAQPSAPTYTGPCDLQTCVVAAGFRAMTASKIGSNIIQLERTSDSTTQNFSAQSDGFPDESAITTFCGAANANGCYWITLYDQIGTNNWTNSSTSLTIDQGAGIGTHSCGYLGTASIAVQNLNVINVGTAVTLGGVTSHAKTSSNFVILGRDTFSGNDFFEIGVGGGSNLKMLNGGTITLNMGGTTDANPWAYAGALAGASSFLAVNAFTPVTGTQASGWNVNSKWRLAGQGNVNATADICEMWLVGSNIGSTAAQAIITNDRTAWGF